MSLTAVIPLHLRPGVCATACILGPVPAFCSGLCLTVKVCLSAVQRAPNKPEGSSESHHREGAKGGRHPQVRGPQEAGSVPTPCLHRLETSDNGDAMGTCQVLSFFFFFFPRAWQTGALCSQLTKTGQARGSVKGKGHLTARLPKCTFISERMHVYSLRGVLTEIGCRAGIWGLTPARPLLPVAHCHRQQPSASSGWLLRSVHPGTDCACSPCLD